MGLFDFIADDLEGITTGGGEPPVCGDCKAAEGVLREMEASRKHIPGSVIDTWACPACSHEVVRGDANNETFV